MENKKNNSDILNEADFLASGEDYSENDGVMIDGQVVSAYNDSLNNKEEEDDKKAQDDIQTSNSYYDKKSFKRMGWGLWLSVNRKNIKNVVIVFLICVSSFFFIYSVYNLVIFFTADDPSKDPYVENLILENKQKPKELRLSAVTRFSSASSDDLAVMVLNPNENYYASFTYCFVLGGEDVDCQQSFIFPEKEKYVFSMGVDSMAGSNLPSIELRDVSFKVMDTKKIPNFENYENERLDFSVIDLDFSPASSRVSNVIDLNNLSFTIINETAYSYYDVALNILIFNNDKLIGVNKYSLDGFKSGENKNVNLSWPGDIRNGTGVEIIPDLDILDENVFSAYKGN